MKSGIAACLSGGFSSMPAHLGALHQWLILNQTKGLLLPEYICTSSASGISGSIAVQRDESAVKIGEEIMFNLRKRQFAGLNPEIRNNGIITIASILGLTFSVSQIAKKVKNPLFNFLATVGVTGLAFSAQKRFIKTLFQASSFLVYDRLYSLLLNTLNFDLIFNSPIRIEIPCVNLNKAGWTLDEILSDPPRYLHGWKNKGWVSVTNFRPEDVNLPTDIRNQKFVTGIVNGVILFGIMKPGRNEDDDALVDTAALNNLPFKFAIDRGYSKIVILYFNRTTEAPSDNAFETWVESLGRSVDILVAEKTRRAIVGALRVNNDLEQLAEQKESLKRLERLLDYKYIDSTSQQIIRRHIQDTNQALTNLSYTHLRRIRFVFARSRLIPDIHFNHFTPDEMIESHSCGAEGLLNSAPEIEKLCEEN